MSMVIHTQGQGSAIVPTFSTFGCCRDKGVPCPESLKCYIKFYLKTQH